MHHKFFENSGRTTGAIYRLVIQEFQGCMAWKRKEGGPYDRKKRGGEGERRRVI
jgi:hypothetical protein